MFSIYILTSVDHVTITLTFPWGVGLGVGLGLGSGVGLGMEALLQAAEEDTREDPLSDDPDDSDFDEDMAQLMRQVHAAFKSEVSGADLRADASKLKDMLAGLQAAVPVQGNTPLDQWSWAKSRFSQYYPRCIGRISSIPVQEMHTRKMQV